MKLSDYTKYNSSFRLRFIYRLGGSTGFFSEYNNMVLAIHYCLVHRIQFVLESEGALFSSGEGWNEFFLPFCDEVKNKWLSRFNYRVKPAYKNRIEWFCFNVYKRIHLKTMYMYSLFETIRRVNIHAKYEISELGLSGTLLDNCKEIHQMIWKYNDKTKKIIEAIIQSLRLPDYYLGFHIRLGDKYEETRLFCPEDYMRHARLFSEEKNVFVLTDDHRAICTLRELYPDCVFYSLCKQDETGYNLNALLKKSKSDQIQSYYRLWASMDVLERSLLFIGTYSANPGMNMGFRMEDSKIKCLDFENWQLW